MVYKEGDYEGPTPVVGQKITFKLKKCNWIPRKETRILRDITPEGRLVVKYAGCDRFYLDIDEVYEED